jgi:cytochrome c oxidase assembly factor CtaG
MIRHLLLLQVGPLLVVTGLPISSAARSSDPDERRGSRPVLPGFSWIVGLAAMTIWFAPPLFAWMMSGGWHHALVELSLVAAGIAFWWPVFGPRRGDRVNTAGAIAYLFSACLGSTIAGASIAFAAPGLYPGHVSSHADQQLAGLVMWVPCCVVYLSAIVTALARWYSGADNDSGRNLARARA